MKLRTLKRRTIASALRKGNVNLYDAALQKWQDFMAKRLDELFVRYYRPIARNMTPAWAAAASRPIQPNIQIRET